MPRGRPQRARSAANMSTESGLNSFGITDSGEDAAGGDEADMEEEVVGESPLTSSLTLLLHFCMCAAHGMVHCLAHLHVTWNKYTQSLELRMLPFFLVTLLAHLLKAYHYCKD